MGREGGGAGEEFRALTINNNNGNLGRPEARPAPDAAGPWGFPLVRPGLLGTAGQSGGVPDGTWCRSARPPRGRPSPPPRRLPGTCSRAPASGGGGARTAAPTGGGLQRASAFPSRRGRGGAGRAGAGVAQARPTRPSVTGRRGRAESPRLPPASSLGPLAGGGGAVPSSRPAGQAR